MIALFLLIKFGEPNTILLYRNKNVRSINMAPQNNTKKKAAPVQNNERLEKRHKKVNNHDALVTSRILHESQPSDDADITGIVQQCEENRVFDQVHQSNEASSCANNKSRTTSAEQTNRVSMDMSQTEECNTWGDFENDDDDDKNDDDDDDDSNYVEIKQNNQDNSTITPQVDIRQKQKDEYIVQMEKNRTGTGRIVAATNFEKSYQQTHIWYGEVYHARTSNDV